MDEWLALTPRAGLGAAQVCVLLIPTPPPHSPSRNLSLLQELALNAMSKGGVLEPLLPAASLVMEPKPLGDCDLRL